MHGVVRIVAPSLCHRVPGDQPEPLALFCPSAALGVPTSVCCRFLVGRTRLQAVATRQTSTNSKRRGSNPEGRYPYRALNPADNPDRERSEAAWIGARSAGVTICPAPTSPSVAGHRRWHGTSPAICAPRKAGRAIYCSSDPCLRLCICAIPVVAHDVCARRKSHY